MLDESRVRPSTLQGREPGGGAMRIERLAQNLAEQKKRANIQEMRLAGWPVIDDRNVTKLNPGILLRRAGLKTQAAQRTPTSERRIERASHYAQRRVRTLRH